ncbi:SOS response-associated peptidase [Mycobacteroides abscessus]|uniref:SOS response-associated peptidase n=1 Tax=Mycobacteroides abscessus TaxID=36809 RepID=UPI000944F267|nr:SOS response-associated peptidase [Mycobacteroides abscessus]MDO3335055.1 SOS response-associated peptidase [Mycobacteroides abscessus subsp. bolletii]QSM87900.1 SOS response-associated peptidase [Mycobacteroides abscessus subsp. bolletii]
MCGRYAVTIDPALLAAEIDAVDETASSAAQLPTIPNYNVAPTDPVLAVVARHHQPGDVPTRRIRAMRWGLVPNWAKARQDGRPESKGAPLINARAETLTTAVTFRTAAQSKRCLVPMDGWYEWRKEDGAKTAFYMNAGDGKRLFAAGLWSVWKPDKPAVPLLSCTIVTTDAVGPLQEIHDRMPLMLGADSWDSWLDPDRELDLGLLRVPDSVAGIETRRVSPLVNSVANNGPELLVPDDGTVAVGEQITLL